MNETKKRLIEVNFPLKEVSDDSVREKSIRQGHISTLHIWWARRPLASSRATALAALIPDPGDEKKRQELLELVRDIAPWEVASKDTAQSRALLEKARKLIVDANGGKPPRVLDCFAGGGAIPLEALRLGCETYALDYNPVAVLLNKAVLEYPQRLGKTATVSDTPSGPLGIKSQHKVNRLLEEVKRWGNWVLTEAHKELSRFYPKDKNGSVAVGCIWARTLPCQNPQCGAEIPLMRQMWLAKKDRNKIAVRLVPDKVRKAVGLEIVDGKKIDFDPDEGTVSRAHVRCPVCGSTIADDDTRRLFREGKSGQRMVAVVTHHPDRTGRLYRLPSDRDLEDFRASLDALENKRRILSVQWGMNPVPDETLPLMSGVFNVPIYGITKWGDLSNARQNLAIVTFTELIRRAHEQMTSSTESELATAITTYLAMALDRLCDYSTTLCVWAVEGGFVAHTFGRQALPMTWDYFEVNPLSGATGDWRSALDWVSNALEQLSSISFPNSTVPKVIQGSATELPWEAGFFDAVLTDPPYYINVPYADLSDFFYVRLKRAIGHLYPELFATPLSPKSQEIGQMAHWDSRRYGEKDKSWFEGMLTKAFCEIERVLKPDGIAVIVFAYPKTEAWEAVVNAILKSSLYLTGSWPIHTEREARLRGHESAALGSSIYMVCRRRVSDDVGEFPRVKQDIEQRVRHQLDKFWNEGIRGADFFMSAIGPAVEIFGRYKHVEKLSGETVEVKELLDYLEKVVSEFALERILGSAELGGVDTETRFYLLWRWTYNNSRVPFDEARKLATAVGTEITALWGDGQFVKKENEFVRVLGPKEREKDKKFMNRVGFSTMVDALQRACIYWERGERTQLKDHFAQTYGANNMFWRVTQNIADVLPDGDKEKQLLQGLLNVPEARDKVPMGTGKLFS